MELRSPSLLAGSDGSGIVHSDTTQPLVTVADELAQAGRRIKRLEEELVAIADRNKTAQTAIAAALTDTAERVETVTKVLDQMLVSGVTLG